MKGVVGSGQRRLVVVGVVVVVMMVGPGRSRKLVVRHGRGGVGGVAIREGCARRKCLVMVMVVLVLVVPFVSSRRRVSDITSRPGRRGSSQAM